MECIACSGTGEDVNGVDGFCWKCQGTGRVTTALNQPKPTDDAVLDAILNRALHWEKYGEMHDNIIEEAKAALLAWHAEGVAQKIQEFKDANNI